MNETETPTLQDIRTSNEEILAKILESGDGEVKTASTAGTNMIRRRVREDGFLRNIIPPETVTNADLDRVQQHDKPVIIEDMEPLSPGAVSLPFGGSADSTFYYGNKFIVVFNEVTTREYVKDINELRTYRMDLRQVITDNALKDVQAREDGDFITLVDTIVGANPANWAGLNSSGAVVAQPGNASVSNAGIYQNWNIYGGFTRDNMVEATKVIENQNLNNGIVLINRPTFKNWAKMTRDIAGGELSQDLFKQGTKALQSTEVLGVKHLVTIKRDLVPDNTIYLFTEPGFLGRFYQLTPLTMYVKKEMNFLRFSARETIGLAIANIAGVAQFNFISGSGIVEGSVMGTQTVTI
jgi:hypothetical protein